MKEGCKTCKFNKERNLKQKTCLKGYRAVYGFGCNEYQRRNKKAVDEMKQKLAEKITDAWKYDLRK